MARIYLNRLAKKYGLDQNNISSADYKRLMQDILARNIQNVSEATAKLSDQHWSKAFAKISTKEKRFIMPDVSEVLPQKAIYIKKAVDNGQLITNTLRDKLSEDLRGSLEEFRTAKTNEPAFIRRRGTDAGTINPKLVELFQDRILDTFKEYTKKDPRFGVPSNIKTIAVTEARSAINDMKEAYTNSLIKKNPDIKMRKKWRQNKQLAKVPRIGHAEVNGSIVDINEKFIVPLYKKSGDQMVRLGSTPMSRPHDPNAPLEQIIGCNCDVEYFAEVEK